MQRLFLAILLGACSTYAQASYYANHGEGTLGHGELNPIAHYVQAQKTYLQHLHKCRPYTLQIRSPLQPSLKMTQHIFGQRYGRCHVQVLYRLTAPAGTPPTVYNCRFNNKQLQQLSRQASYHYLNQLAARLAKRVVSLQPKRTRQIMQQACRIS